MKKIIDGNYACSYVAYNFIEACGIYPITPSSPMSENIDVFSNVDKRLNYFKDRVKLYQMQSEAGAVALCHGLLQNGVFSSTFTASQGLLLMLPNMYKIAGEMLPFVINVASRSIATHALSIFGDHQDIYAARTTGFAIFLSSSVQQVMDLTSAVYLSTIDSNIPFINSFDGFRTSHEYQKVDLIDLNEINKYINKNKIEEFKQRALYKNNVTRGTHLNDDLYFQLSEAHNIYYNKLPEIVEKNLEIVNKITNNDYHIMDYYGSKNAKKVIVAMGSVCQTIREVCDNSEEEIGLVEIHLFRPFSIEYLNKILPSTVESIAVLDRTKDSGEVAPLYLDVLNALKNKNIKVLGGRYGLSSRDTNIYDIKAVYDFLDQEDTFDNFTIGIIDDLNNKSLKPVRFVKKFNNQEEILIYGYGSDGMVSASKNIISIIGEKTNNYVQGYFEYDSKKQGGLTKSHLRISNDLIKSSYYVNEPKIVVCTKTSYLEKYKMLDNIVENGIFILNTNLTDEELNNYFTDNDKKIIKDKNIKVYKVNASKIAIDNNINGKINNIMSTIIFKFIEQVNFDDIIMSLKEMIKTKFKNKDSNIIDSNLKGIDQALNLLVLVDTSKFTLNGFDLKNDLYSKLLSKRGYEISVKEVLHHVDGTFWGGMNRKETRPVADFLPVYTSSNCITCNKCSYVCPHGVIRPFLLTEEEKNNAPKYIQEKLINANIPGKNYYYIIGISYKNCTGCGACFNTCPGKMLKKALDMKSSKDALTEDFIKTNDYLFENIKDKEEVFNKYTVKGSQFISPAFAFSGACAGCGETPYLKLLTQLFKDELVIANATGCSSIYGGEAPATSYSIPWANSLFEDAAEFGLGLKLGETTKKEKIKEIISINLDKIKESEKEIYLEYLNNPTIDNSKKLLSIIDNTDIKELLEYKEDIMPKSVWIVGGDGWAYDIGFGGLDHVLATGSNVNILVLDTEVYSNTGGQTSKSTNIGSVNKFAITGCKQSKKNLAKYALTYENVYVAQVSLGANPNQVINAFKEAKEYNGPSIIIAYAPCIEHGLKNGMGTSEQETKEATLSGYFPIFRYNPIDKKFTLDSKSDFDKYEDFLMSETRYKVLEKTNPFEKDMLIEKNKEEAINRYEFYKNKMEKNNE